LFIFFFQNWRQKQISIYFVFLSEKKKIM
jgi:hypothetical protein